MLVSPKKTVVIAWLSTTLVVIGSISLFIPFALLAEHRILPLYIAIPLALVVPVAIMIASFHLLAIRWLIWAFKNVADVRELEKALYISGFGAYGIDSLEKKHEASFLDIKHRFDSYEFVDDINVPYETTIYNKAFYQNGYFVFFALMAIFMTIVAIIFSGDGPNAAFIIPPLFAGFAIFQYIQIASRSPQLILNEEGITQSNSFFSWEDIDEYKIIPGKTSYLRFYLNELEKECVIDYLNISKVQLNHLMFVYQQRHRKTTPNSR